MFMLDRSRITIEDLRKVSQASREAGLDQELAQFEGNLDISMADKNHFLEQLYRRLKQITSTWKSWHRRKAGSGRGTQFISRKQIEDLVHWDRSMNAQRKHKKETKSLCGEDKPVDMLIRFIQACKESQDLFNQFNSKIYWPLNEFFNDDQVRPLAKALTDVVHRWKGLLSPGPINHRLFSPRSANAVYYMEVNNRPRDSQFNLVLRLVPDLALKAFEALCLAKQWRARVGPSGYTRELKYIYSKWIPEKREMSALKAERAQTKECEFVSKQDRLQTLQSKLVETEKELAVSSHRMSVTARQTGRLNGEFESIQKELDHTGSNVKRASGERGKIARSMGKLKEYIDMLQDEMRREQQDVQRTRAKLIHSEFSCRYSDDREMTKVLEADLSESIARCQHLRKEISRAEHEYDSQHTTHPTVHTASDKLNWVCGGLDMAKPERFSVSRKLLKFRDKQREQIAAADNFHLLREELQQSKLSKQVLLRQMLQPRQEDRPWTTKILDF